MDGYDGCEICECEFFRPTSDYGCECGHSYYNHLESDYDDIDFLDDEDDDFDDEEDW